MHDVLHNPAASAVRAEAPALPCVGCGYDLRGSAAHGKCPECGVDVWKSLHGGRLDHVDPKWLTRVFWGQRLIYWAWNAMLLLISTTIIACLGLMFGLNSQPPLWLDAVFALWIFFIHAVVITAAVGSVLATWPEPREQGVGRTPITQRIARWGFPGCAALFLLVETSQSSWILGRGGDVALMFLLLPLYLISASCVFAHFGNLARRLARENVGEQLGELLSSYAAILQGFALVAFAAELMTAICLWIDFDMLTTILLFFMMIVVIGGSIVLVVVLFFPIAVMRDLNKELGRCLVLARHLYGANA